MEVKSFRNSANRDWQICRVSALAAKLPNAVVGGPFGSDLTSKDYVLTGIPVIRGQNMGKKYVDGEFVYIDRVKGKKLQANMAKPGDLVFTQRGTLGQVAIVPEGGYREYLVSQSQMKVSLDRGSVDVDYVYQFFSSSFGQKQVLDSAIQTGVPHTNLGILRSYLVPLPPTLAEQEAIAGALSDADAWIESLEQLIAKKRKIKKGAMQELLTGKRRLPGFKSEWQTKKLGDEIDLLTGFPFPSQGYSKSGVRLLRGSNIKRGATDWDDSITQYWSYITPELRQYALQVGDIVIAMDGSLVGRSFAQLSHNDLPALLLQRVARIRCSTATWPI